MPRSMAYDPNAYQRGRALSADAIQHWMAQLGRYVPPTRAEKVLDLGCGTGRFSVPLADFYAHASVVGVEPSIDMLNAARRNHPHPRVSYTNGVGERIPLADASCDLVFVSMVLHHLKDEGAVAAELERIVKPDGHLFIRAAFRNRLDGIPHYDFFPSAKTIDNQQLPSLEATQKLLSERSFHVVAVDIVHQVVAPDLAAYADRLSLRAISTMKLLPDEEFDEGLTRMRDAAGQPNQRPVTEAVDLLVLRRQ